MATKLETYTGFNLSDMSSYFADRAWPVNIIRIGQTNLVRVKRGAALECGDGRFDKLETRSVVDGKEIHGVRVFGGINVVMALHTGGDEVGLQRATELIKKFGATPGTHSAEEGGCGYAELWMKGELRSARFPYELHDHVKKGGLRLGTRLADMMHSLGGRHFRLNGNHEEEAVRINPFKGYTEAVNDGLRFRVDDWFMAQIGIPDHVRWFKIAESVEKLKPDATRLEIIIP